MNEDVGCYLSRVTEKLVSNVKVHMCMSMSPTYISKRFVNV